MSFEQYRNAVEQIAQHAEKYIRPQIVYSVWLVCLVVPFIGTVIAWGMADSNDKDVQNDQGGRDRPYFTSSYSFAVYVLLGISIAFNFYASFFVNAQVDKAIDSGKTT